MRQLDQNRVTLRYEVRVSTRILFKCLQINLDRQERLLRMSRAILNRRRISRNSPNGQRTDPSTLDNAAPQDWMCEPFMIERTGLRVAEHLHRTVENYLTLRRLAPGLPFIPCVQGWRLADYLACLELYASAGVDLAALPRVGLGSVCRRQSTAEIAVIVTELARRGLRLHGFGVKTGGLHLYGHLLASADSMAWSYAARRAPALPGCTGHKNCANCLVYATRWRSRVLSRYATRGYQGSLFDTSGWTAPPERAA
jgi:hypothetical protein